MIRTMHHFMQSQDVISRRQETLALRQNRGLTIRAGFWAISLVIVVMMYTMGFHQFLRMFSQGAPEGDYAAFVNIEGTIAPDTPAAANNIIAGLRSAFKDKKAKGLVIRINSPGGTPVQASLVYDYIMRQKADYDRDVICVGEDYVTSGAYFIAAACDKIFINRSTMAGSIGVKMESYGLTELAKKAGVERRIIANDHAKVRADMWMPLSNEDRSKLEEIISKTHEHFISSVKEGRGERLVTAEDILFSGDMWNGDEALAMGLVDGLSDLNDVLQKQMGVEYIRNFTFQPNPLESLMGMMNTSVVDIWETVSLPRLMLTP
jgi:protease-4